MSLGIAVEHRIPIRFILSFWLFVLSAISFLDRTNVSIAGPQLIHAFGLSNQRLGWIFSAFLVGYASFQVPAGILAVRFGPRSVLALGVLIWAICNVLTALLPAGFSQAIVLLVLLRCFLGVAEAVIYPAANQFVARWIPQKGRGLINGLIFAGVGAGSGFTPPLLTWIIANLGWRAAFCSMLLLVQWAHLSGGRLRAIDQSTIPGSATRSDLKSKPALLPMRIPLPR